MGLSISSDSAVQLNLGLMLGIVAIGAYTLVNTGLYSTLGPPTWAPHAYNYVIWGTFGAILVKRFGAMAFPALIMVYAMDEVVWTAAYVSTVCSKVTGDVSWFASGLGGPEGFYVGIIVIAVITFALVSPSIHYRWYIMVPWAAWLVFYITVMKMPEMGNLCIGIQPQNFLWEVSWQLGWLIPAWFTFYPGVTR